MAIAGLFGLSATSSSAPGIPLHIQPSDIDSLEPKYNCPASTALINTYGPNSANPIWQRHLTSSSSLLTDFDALSGVDPNDPAWHTSYDHYFDNLSARLCHQMPLPCNSTFHPERCISRAQADAVFRLGEWEYSWLYRGAGADTLRSSRGSFGVWMAELARNLRDARDGSSTVIYRHNVAHDGSLSRLPSLLQIEEMVWPGMGSEIIFELWQRSGGTDEDALYVRILWSGQVLRSSTPILQGDMGMLPLEKILGYLDGMVGMNANMVKDLCGL